MQIEDDSKTGHDALDDEWLTEHFDHLDPAFHRRLDEAYASMRARCPVVHSDRHGGFWAVTRYDDVLEVFQDWPTYRNGMGVAVPPMTFDLPVIPDETDPPEHTIYKRLINAHFTPAKVAPFEAPTRATVTALIDAFIADGRCEFMMALARQLPRLTFFDLVLHASTDELHQLNEWTNRITSLPRHPDFQEAQDGVRRWIGDFIDQRRSEPARDDVIGALLGADIGGRPITDTEIMGTIMQLMFGGFDTTAAALGHIVVRLAAQPDLLARLRNEPATIPAAIEECLRLDPPVVCMGRTAAHDAELGGCRIGAGDKVLFAIASANRDESEFPHAGEFDLDRARNRHLTFGAGPHKCAGSNLARLNLRVAVEELTRRLDDIRVDGGVGAVEYRTAFTRAPAALPITFRPAPTDR